MKNTLTGYLSCLFVAGLLVFGSACSPKVGCPASENAQVDLTKKKNKRGGKSSVFDPKASKKMGIRN